MAALGRYPWPHLSVLSVDSSITADLWEALERYVERTDRPVRADTLDRWLRACGLMR